eukprot:GHVQ01042373.1.p1 GENE.GHVQ01042373.1~~GHVQ01042373.1.p1  ORF type:complete len:549 (+),score=74.53 GHVQ01042373.1:241-1887(+)
MQQDRIALRWSVCCIIFCVIEHVALSLACVHRLLLSTHGNHPLRMLGSHLSASYDKHGRSIGCWSGDHHNVLHVESPVVTSSLFVDSQTYHRTIWLDIPSAYSQRQRKPSIANCCCSGKVCDTGSIYTRLLPASNYLAQSLKVMFVLYRIQVGCGVGGGRELSCRLKDHHRLCMEESKQRNCGPLSLSSQRARPTESVYEKESVCYYDRHRQSIFNATPLINSSPMNPQKTEGYFFLTNRRSIADESCERRSNLLSLPATTVYSSRPPTNPFERLSRAWLGWSSRERRKEESTKNENHYAETVDGTDQHWRQQEEQQRHHGNISIGVEQPDQQLQTQNQQQQQPQKQRDAYAGVSAVNRRTIHGRVYPDAAHAAVVPSCTEDSGERSEAEDKRKGFVNFGLHLWTEIRARWLRGPKFGTFPSSSSAHRSPRWQGQRHASSTTTNTDYGTFTLPPNGQEAVMRSQLKRLLETVKKPYQPSLTRPLRLTYVCRVASEVWKDLDQLVTERERKEQERERQAELLQLTSRRLNTQSQSNTPNTSSGGYMMKG